VPYARLRDRVEARSEFNVSWEMGLANVVPKALDVVREDQGIICRKRTQKTHRNFNHGISNKREQKTKIFIRKAGNKESRRRKIHGSHLRGDQFLR